jgi:hypothetical protein
MQKGQPKLSLVVELVTQAQTRRMRSRDVVRAYFAGAAGTAGTASAAFAASAFTLALPAL